MINAEYYKKILEERSEHSYYDDFNTPFSEYIKSPDGKLVITITKCQYVFDAEPSGDHALMAVDLIRKIRPDLKIDDWGNAYNRDEDFREHNIFLFGYRNFSLVSLPKSEMLSVEQYNKLEEILLNIKEYNERQSKSYRSIWELFIDAPENSGIKSGNYETRIDELLEDLKNYITDDYVKPNEEIIGTSLSIGKEI